MATVEIRELIKPETGEKFYPYAHLNGVKGAELLPRIGSSVQTTLPTPIFQIRDALNAQFYPQTHADAVIGLAQMIESNQFFVKESDGNGGFRIKLKDEFTGFYANGWVASGGIGQGGSGGGGLITSVKGIADLGTPIANESLTETFSAKAIESIWEAVLGLQQSMPSVSLNNGVSYSTIAINGTSANFYTKAQVDTLLNAINAFDYVVAASLPTASANTMYKIYLIPSADPQTGNIKDEYITIRGGSEGGYTYSWEQIGSTAIDLTGYATESWVNQQGFLKTETDPTVPAWAKASSKPSYTLDEIADGSTRKLANYLPLAGGTMTGSILTSADSTNSIGASGTRFLAGHIRNLYTTYFAFMSDDGQTQVGNIGMGSGYASINLNGTPNVSYNFFGEAGFFHSGNGDAPCGRSDHRWEKVWSVDADLSGDLVLSTNAKGIYGTDTSGNARNLVTLANDNGVYFGHPSAARLNFSSTGVVQIYWGTYEAGQYASFGDIPGSAQSGACCYLPSMYPNHSNMDIGMASSRWRKIYAYNMDLSGSLVVSGDILPATDNTGNIGTNDLRFSTAFIRNIYTSFLQFRDGTTKTPIGQIGFGEGYVQFSLLGNDAKNFMFYSDKFFASGGNADLGLSDHRWSNIYGVNANLTGDLALASTSHIDIGPARIEYDATNGAIHVTTNQTGNNAPTIGFYADGFSASGGIGDGGGGGGFGVEQITTNEDGTIDFHFTGGDITTVDLNHEHPQYPKYVQCTQAEYDALTTKESDTLYLIPATA